MASSAEILAIKRSRYTTDADADKPDVYYGHLRAIPPGPHVPNSNEAHVLRRLMAQTGLTEAELRENKCYRIELSEAQKSKGTKTPLQRLALRARKSVTRELQLPREHPLVKETFITAWPKYNGMRMRFIPVTALDAWASIIGL